MMFLLGIPVVQQYGFDSIYYFYMKQVLSINKIDRQLFFFDDNFKNCTDSAAFSIHDQLTPYSAKRRLKLVILSANLVDTP